MATKGGDRVESLLRRSGVEMEDIERWFQYALIGFVLVGTVVPMLMLIVQAVSTGSIIRELSLDIGLANFAESVRSPTFQDAIKNTFIFSLGSVIISHILGGTFAFILTRLEVPHSSKFHTMMFLPIFVSPLVLSLGFLFSFAEGGYYHGILRMLGVTININNVYGMVFISSIWLTPFSYSFISAGLQNIDPEMEDAARITGASDLKVLTNVSIPLLKPFLLSSIFISVLLTFQEISIPAILGLPDRIYVLSTYLLALQQKSTPPPYGELAAVGVIMVIISISIVFGITRIIGDVSQYTVITGRGRERTIDTSKPVQYAAAVFLGAYLLVFIFGPLFQILSVGLTEGGNISRLRLAALSPEWFIQLWETDSLRIAVRNSLGIALITASASVIFTGVISYISNRVDSITSTILGSIIWVPIATPGVVLGLAYLWTVLVFDVGLYGTVRVLIIAFFIRYLALGVRMNNSLITQQAEELDEQAKICGAGLFSRLRNVVFPNAKNGMMSVWVILFTLFMAELSTSIFLYTTSSRVITVTIFELWRTAQYGALGALATTQVLIIFAVVFAMIKLFDINIRAV